jgi:phage regulator Rha-like protein
MSDLVFLQDQEPSIRTGDIWKLFGYASHKNLREVIDNRKERFERTGVLRSATAKPAPGTKGGRPEKGYLLSERQFVTLIQYVGNTEESMNFKDKIADEFFRLREELKQLNKPSAHIEEIRKLLLLDAPSEWVRLFPPEFYTALMKLYGKEFISNNHTPPYCGQITRKQIYDRVLPKELQLEIDAKILTERKHQWFTENNGRATLLNQINQVTGIAKMSRDRTQFEANCAIAFDGAPLQLSVFL